MALAELLLPSAPGTTVYEKNGTTIDASHADQGYIMVRQTGLDKKLKLQITKDGETLTYDLNAQGEFEVFPLQMGDGKYTVQVFSQVSGTRYATVSSHSFTATVVDPLLPFLYPNQYVNYDASTLAVAKAQDLLGGLSTPREKFQTAYDYVVSHTVYDYMRALQASSGQLAGYLPDLDDVYTANKGICFDIAALLACMLRSQGVATRLVIGYANTSYHAWNEVWLDDQWVRCDATADICNMSAMQYTTQSVY